jgi:hypothetical protein
VITPNSVPRLAISCNSSMNKIIFYTLAFLFCLPTQAQQRFFGVIQDADGYTNVRDTSGTVIGKLLDNHVFVDWDAQKSHKEWHSVIWSRNGHNQDLPEWKYPYRRDP